MVTTQSAYKTLRASAQLPRLVKWVALCRFLVMMALMSLFIWRSLSTCRVYWAIMFL